MVLPSVDNISTLTPVSGIARTVPLCLPQRRTPFPMPGSWAVMVHEFITLTILFTDGLDISTKLLCNGC